MSAFYDAIDAAVAAGTQLMCRRAVEFDFEGATLRLWEGNGKLFTSDGKSWLGWIIGEQSYLDVPTIVDGRDGAAPLYTFRLGFLDRATFEGLRADQDKVRDRPLTVWRCYMARGEGLRPAIPPGHPTRLTMKSAGFEEDRTLSADGETVRLVASVNARPADEGRTYAPGDTVTDVNQRIRAAALGVEGDRYARFVPLQKNRKIVVF